MKSCVSCKSSFTVSITSSVLYKNVVSEDLGSEAKISVGKQSAQSITPKPNYVVSE